MCIFYLSKLWPFLNLEICELRLILDGTSIFTNSSTVFLGAQFETLYKCYINTVMCMCLVIKVKKLLMTKLLLFRT